MGRRLPSSAESRVVSHLASEGLDIVTAKKERVGKDFDLCELRATGTRFDLPGRGFDHARALRDALAVGAGYVELRDPDGDLRAVATTRLVDFSLALVGPMACLPAHFSRFDIRGQCPMCGGAGQVQQFAENLVIGNRMAPPADERFLTPDANRVLRGVRRNELVPFLRRLSVEGLWNADKPYDKLAFDERAMLFHGFWSRPGPGSFLKPRAEPAEVASWLGWDGLSRNLATHFGRSQNSDWLEKMRASQRSLECPRCHGTGLQLFAQLLKVGHLAFTDWARLTDEEHSLKALGRVRVRSERQRLTFDRILRCLKPVAGLTPLIERIAGRAVTEFTTMRVARSTDVEGE